jgi:hypothetical protein
MEVTATVRLSAGGILTCMVPGHALVWQAQYPHLYCSCPCVLDVCAAPERYGLREDGLGHGPGRYVAAGR